MCAGDVYLFFTDGVTEAMNVDGEFFGEERLRKLFLELAASPTPAKEVRDGITAALKRFHRGTQPFDDITLVVVRVDRSPTTGTSFFSDL
ncbi:MAG TPA: SpoIIE family protein phosphatase, partial [Candidatus Sumerlaeota bacterium]|nr:SpoIIE family protein phosphatase [Candidatus Sumerlaeota bacterium]